MHNKSAYLDGCRVHPVHSVNSIDHTLPGIKLSRQFLGMDEQNVNWLICERMHILWVKINEYERGESFGFPNGHCQLSGQLSGQIEYNRI